MAGLLRKLLSYFLYPSNFATFAHVSHRIRRVLGIDVFADVVQGTRGTNVGGDKRFSVSVLSI
jgi:hypothetical protein